MTSITVKSAIPFKEYFRYIFRENFFKPLPLLIFIFTLINLFLLVNYFFRFLYFNLHYPWFQIIIVPLVLIIIPSFFYYVNRKEYNNNPLLREQKAFEFTESGVRISTDAATVLIDWQNLYKVEESRDFLILFYDYATAYFVLKSDFENQQQLNTVLEIIKSKPGLVYALLK